MHRSLLLAGICLAGIALSPLPVAAVTVSPQTAALSSNRSTTPVHYDLWRHRGWYHDRYYRQNSYERYCARLRRACIYKEERGEVGLGNCRRYRSECGRW